MWTYPKMECKSWHFSSFPPLGNRSKLAFKWERDLCKESGFELDHTKGSKNHMPFFSTNFLHFAELTIKSVRES